MNYQHLSTYNEYSLRNRSIKDKVNEGLNRRPIYNNLTSYKANQKVIRNFTPRQQRSTTYYQNNNTTRNDNTTPYSNVNTFNDSRIILYQKPKQYLQTEPNGYQDEIEPIYKREQPVYYENRTQNDIDFYKIKENFGLLSEKLDRLKSIFSEKKPTLKVAATHKSNYDINNNNNIHNNKKQKVSTSHSKQIRKINDINTSHTISNYKHIQIPKLTTDALRNRVMYKGIPKPPRERHNTVNNNNTSNTNVNTNNITLDNYAYNGGFNHYKKLLPKNLVNTLNANKDSFDSSSEIKEHRNNTEKLFTPGYKNAIIHTQIKSPFSSNHSNNNNNHQIVNTPNDKVKGDTHEKDLNTSINLSDIADDLVHTFDIDQPNIDDIKADLTPEHTSPSTSDLFTTNEVNLMISQTMKHYVNNSSSTLLKPRQSDTEVLKFKEQVPLSISNFSVNILNEPKPEVTATTTTETQHNVVDNEQSQTKETKAQDDIDSEDDLLIMEIMQKVEEENELKKNKKKHVEFNHNENILIQYNDKHNITSLDIVKEKTKEKMKFVPRKMNLYTQILKSKNKPKGIIKPFNSDDIKTDMNFVMEDYPDEDSEEEEVEDNEEDEDDNKESEGDKKTKGEGLVENIRKMFDDDEDEEQSEEEDNSNKKKSIVNSRKFSRRSSG